MEDNEIHKEKKAKLEKYISQAEKCLLLSRKANKLMDDLDELDFDEEDIDIDLSYTFFNAVEKD